MAEKLPIRCKTSFNQSWSGEGFTLDHIRLHFNLSCHNVHVSYYITIVFILLYHIVCVYPIRFSIYPIEKTMVLILL